MNKPAAARILLCISTLILAGWLQGCATATGPAFSNAQAPENGKGLVYLYRTSAFFAIAQSFLVHADGKEAGRLPNASYLALQLPPGVHSLKVTPGGLGRTSVLDIEVRAGTTSFYQYDFATGALANSFFIGASIKPRDPAMALVNLKNLTAASPRPGPDSNSTSLYGRLDETNTVSAVSGSIQAGYRK
ncbi:DUF2846 domain-containing protein [Azohydromonas caseinilytica]|uniref:DUF2846 domain-containing protein n=1 Tax=Azohydromonas caseinilytica TaxID=2728836 RepID=A0A848F1N4_9BURK|nr:DUF2846 domain-containing protein [Azohydromonas caseinilytica]NML13594.1 DUF2846 domain-containing protein [Azohydromonas caseinilytica]